MQDELEIIHAQQNNVFVSLALNDDWKGQLEAIDELSRRATVFLSYSRRSKESVRLAPLLADALRGRDYRVFLDIESLEPGAVWADQIHGGIDRAVERGFVLALLSPEAITAESVAAGVRYALDRYAERGRQSGVVPIIASQRDRTLALLASFPPLPRQSLDFTVGALEDNVAALIEILTQEQRF